MKIEHLHTVDSTNQELKRRVEACAPNVFAALRADYQSEGRGRRGRTWINTRDALMMSAAVPIGDVNPESIPLVSFAAALAAHDAIFDGRQACSSERTGIKWPNDVLLDGKKVCGILTELVRSADGVIHAVIGIGINVNEDSFPTDLLQPAVSMKQFFGVETDKGRLADKLLDSLLKRIEQLKKNEDTIIDEFCGSCININRTVIVHPNFEEPFEAYASAVDECGRLIVNKSDGSIQRISSADVSVRWTPE